MDPAIMSRTSLPPIQYLAEEKSRHQERQVQPQPQYRENHAMSAPAPVTSAYPTGPPPPYSASTTFQSQPSSQRTWASAGEGALKYHDSRPPTSESHRKMLPSLSEALGVPSGPIHIDDGGRGHQVTQSAGTVASSPRRTSIGVSPPQSGRLVHEPASRTFSQRDVQPTDDTPRPRHHEHLPSVQPPYQPQSLPIATNSAYNASTYAASHSNQYDTSPKSARDQAGFGHPFAGSVPTSTAPLTSTSMYTASQTQANDNTQAWRAGLPAVNPMTQPRPAQAYSESVKRHLDFYDFEMALNEISEQSSTILDFSRQHSARLHQSQRSGIVSSTLPTVTEIDDLIANSRRQLEALGRMKDVMVAHHAACFQQSQQQTQPEDGRRNDSLLQPDESRDGGFAGSEPKKRRGRNAAPGRCHSCNRAETPEWRRGPDGARTLCNACGLHYAKLTRKAGINKASIGNSNLRPKTREDGSEA